MELELAPFMNALRKGDTKKAREWIEQNREQFDPGDEFQMGYLLALSGMVAALESGSELSVIKRVIDEGCREERINRFIREVRGRPPLKFRPRDEQGFDTAWADALGELLKERV